MPTTDPELLRRRAALAETVRRLREGHGWTQEELAHQAGFDRKSVNRIENAAYSPTVDRLFVLAAALGLTASEILAETELPPGRQSRRTA
jgi:transcriptional regulator with XRE-family HTH domain